MANEVWKAVSADASELESPQSIGATALAIQEIWPTGVPAWIDRRWNEFKSDLDLHREGWNVWTRWYEARLYGTRLAGVPIENLELARVLIPEEIWQQGPKVVNAHIKKQTVDHEFREQRIADSAWEGFGAGGTERTVAPPSIPASRPAAVEPIWEDGRLTIAKAPPRTDLSRKKFSAALLALRVEFRELAEEILAEANIDKRPAAFLRRIADRIPEAPPTQDELFRLGHVEAIFAGYNKTVREEWPDFLAARYQALALQFDRTIRQSPLWREFKRNASQDTLSNEQIAESVLLGQQAAKALQESEAADFVDRSIPSGLQKLGEVLSTAEGVERREPSIQTAGELLAADLIESVNNVLKPIAEVALTAAGDYGEAFGKGFKRAAKKQGSIDGEKAFKWLRRFVIWSASGGAAGTGTFAALSQLLAKYPHAFEWFEHVLKFLK